MNYAFHFGPNGIQPVEGLGEVKNPVVVGDLLAVWVFEDPKHPRYLIDGMEGGMTPVGTFEKEVGAVTFRDGTLLIATKEYVEAHMAERSDSGDGVASVD